MDASEVREALTRWRQVSSQRDALFRAAREAGISKYEIHQLTGVARTTIDRILSSGEPMTTHTAAIGLTRFAANSDQCNVTVIVNDDTLPEPWLSDNVALPATPLPVSVSEPDNAAKAQRAAEAFLPVMGWHLTGPWEAVGTGGAVCAPVVRGSRVNDPDMRDAIVKGLAQWILRGELHTKRPAHSEAQILARVKHELRWAEAEGYTFPDDSPESIAADAQKLADDVASRNINWDEWAFGH